MESSWRYSVRRLENPGDIIERRPVTMPEGIYIFQLIRKAETPTFEALAEQFEAEWDAFYEDVMNPAPEVTEEEGDPHDTTEGNQMEESDAPTSTAEVSPQQPDTSDTEENQSVEQPQSDDADKNQSMEPNESEDEVESETDSDQPEAEATTEADVESEEDGETEGDTEAEEDEDELKVYRKHGFRGRWEDPSAVASDAQRLYAGEFSSRPIQTRKSFRLIKVDKKRNYRGDIYFYGADRYSYERQNATRIGRRWSMRWGHTQSFYTPWDSREAGRRPINFTGRTELQARNFKEELKLPSESRLNTFGILTYGTGLSTDSYTDRDENDNLTFSRETIGDITSRLEVRHIHDFTGEGTTSLQKLPQFTLNFSRMRVSALPFLEDLNNKLVTISENNKTETPFLSLFTIPTLESASFDLDLELGNFFREVYKGKAGEERDVFLQTLDLGFDVRKQTTLLITPLRELQMSLDFNTNMIWHDRDQAQNRNIVKGVYSFNGTATNTLFRVFNVDYIPGLRKLRHEMQSSLRFNYQPAVDEDDNLYPFGPSTLFL